MLDPQNVDQIVTLADKALAAFDEFRLAIHPTLGAMDYANALPLAQLLRQLKVSKDLQKALPPLEISVVQPPRKPKAKKARKPSIWGAKRLAAKKAHKAAKKAHKPVTKKPVVKKAAAKKVAAKKAVKAPLLPKDLMVLRLMPIKRNFFARELSLPEEVRGRKLVAIISRLHNQGFIERVRQTADKTTVWKRLH